MEVEVRQEERGGREGRKGEEEGREPGLESSECLAGKGAVCAVSGLLVSLFKSRNPIGSASLPAKGNGIAEAGMCHWQVLGSQVRLTTVFQMLAPRVVPHVKR